MFVRFDELYMDPFQIEYTIGFNHPDSMILLKTEFDFWVNGNSNDQQWLSGQLSKVEPSELKE